MTPFFTQKTKYRKNQTANSGFTLVELLAVVAILLLVGLIAVFSLNKLRRTLRQHELDARAQIIYVAAQNRLAELRAAGQEALCINGFDKSDSIVHKMEYDPRHMDESAKNTDFYYLLVNDTSDKSQTAATALLPSSAVDQELWNGYWCIEFAPETGSIYAVFYSEATLPGHDDLNASYRNFNYRLKTASVGYYGGDIAQTQDISKFNPSITIENAEKLIVTFYCNNPVSEKMTFKIDISDKSGGTFTRTITNFAQLDKYNYKYQWILDSLAAEKGIGDAGAARFAAQTNYQVSRGTPITITLTVSSANPSVDTVSTSRTTNGLFDDRADLSYGENTALVSCGRHLANLDSSSRVSSTITSAVQISDISFSDDPADPSDWYSLYTAKDVNFKPISNNHLTSYVGSSSIGDITARHTINGLTVSSNSPAGLFSNFSGNISNVTLVNANIISNTSAAGALVGRATGSLKLANCRVYLADSDLSGMKAASADKIPSRITGTHAGSLVGVYENSSTGSAQANGTLIIENSFAATTINSTTAAGGLVGHAAGAVSVSQSYADCYLTAQVTGGLVGTTTGSGGLTLSDSYAAGYQTATDSAAGFVAGYLTKATNSYSACAYLGNPQAVYTTAKTSTNIATDIVNVFYLTSGLEGKQRTDLSNTSGKCYVDMSAAQFLTDLGGNAFAAASADTTHPYNLLNQGLSTYSYPRLVKLSHYGDWQAEFETEALVYYERYSDNSVGFFGGNVDNLADDKTIVGDGYAVALSAPLSGTLAVTYSGKSETFNATTTSYLTSAYGGTNYCLYPVKILTTGTDISDTSFYHSVTVNGRTYQFNPYFAKTVTTGNGTRAPASVYLRTARHLYELSRHYGGLAAATANTTFRQERDIGYDTYEWTTYTAVTSQEPIHSAVNAADAGDTGGFRAVYDGGGHTIRGVSFVSAGNDVGMFAVIAPGGMVRNVTLLSDSSSNTSKSTVERSGLIQGSTTVVYMGTLAGRNYGTVSNCAVSGYALGGASGVAAYQHSTVYLGGLVGGNLYHKTHSGRIVSSEANCPLAEVSAYSAAVYAGGFTGSNAGGSIQSCYALGVLKARDVSASTVRLCGFAGENAGGALAYCYSATALTAAGEAEVYGLTRTGGSAAQCYYLDGGTYAYGEGLYAYNVSGNSFRVNAAQSPINGANLETQSLYGFTKLTASGTEAVYPYPAVVRDAVGKTVHYGPWPKQRHIGTMGVFYWEREQGGNAGYHLSYIGTDNGVAFSGSTLCVQHNDSGVVMEYGYGYFFKPGGLTDTVRLDVSANCRLGAVNEAAGSALKAQMPEYEFVAYTTGAGQATDTKFTGAMYLTGEETNCTWTLKYGDAESVYTLCPFFADAMSLDSISITGTQFSDAHKPGTAGKPYQVRSVSQLQNINWNYGTKSVDHSITSSNDENITKYPYLGSYRNSVGWREDNFGNQTRRYWVQSHDVDAAAEYDDPDHLFTPIGNMVDRNNGGGTANPYVSFFCSDYDGGAYTIRNVRIESTAQCVGLFGYTIGANLKDIVMYSDRGSKIVNDENGTGWYAVGGLVGFAGVGKDNASFTNCSVSGYTIRDIRENPSGWGGGCVGGLVGATNMNITGCTAVTDIELNPGYNTAWNNLRVGGIAGVCRATLDKCYAGGSITVGKLNTYHSGYGNSTSIWVGGLVGGIILRDHGSLESYMGTTTNALTVRNSYAFVELPPLNNDANKNHVKATYSIASNGEMLNAFAPVTNSVAYIKNCYALIDTAANANDYNAFGKSADTNWAAELDLNHYTKNGENNRQEKQRRVLITNNGKTPYITYEQMQTELKDLLNGGESTSTLKFDTVTVKENGAPIPGKYSFPGANAEMLDGLDFPFPTILTQKDVAGRTVNVHYGRWPTSGLYWERTRTTLDLCADRSGEGAPTLTVALYQYPAVADATDMPEIALVNDTDGQTSDLLDWTAPVYNSTAKCWTVTFTGKGRTGLVIARAKLGGHTAEMTIDVTQTLLLTSDKAASGVSVRYGGESETVQLTLTDAKNKPIAAKQGESLTWEVTATKQGGGYDPGDESIVECSAVTAVDAASGLYQFTVSGFSGGISTVSVTCTYTYPEGTGQKSVTARLLLNAKSTRDAVGLVYDAAEDTRVYAVANGEYRSELNDTSKAGRADVTVPEFSREVGKLYLFAGSGYTELGDFEVVTSGLSAVNAEGKTVAVTATPGAIQTAEGVQYREVTFISTDEALISGEIVLRHKDGAVYTLHLEEYTYKPTT